MLSESTEKILGQKRKYKFQNLFSLSELIVLFFLFLGALNFLNRSAFCVFVAFVAFLVFCGNYIKVSNEVVLLLLFTISLLIFWEAEKALLSATIRKFAYPMCFLVGYNLPRNHKKICDKENAFKVLAIVLALGTWTHLMLNFIINFTNEDETRNTIDFWLGSELSATGQATLACLTIAVAVALLFSKNKLWIKISAVVVLVLVFYYNLILAGRSMFILLLVAAAVALFNFMRAGNKFTRAFIVLLCILIVVVACVVIYNNNVFGIRDIIEDSNLYQRFFGEESSVDVNQDTRNNRKAEYLKYLVDFPFGGGHINEKVGGFAHDLYLDTYDEAGVFACLFIILVVISYIVKTIKILRSKKVSFGTKQMLLCLLFVLNVQFWMEPILAGAAWLLSCFCLLYGNICSLADSLDEPKRADQI